MTTTTVAPAACHSRSPFVTDEQLLLRRPRVGPLDRSSAADILALLPRLSDWPPGVYKRNAWLRGATAILNWLGTCPGEGWQERWIASGADNGTGWIDTLAPEDPRSAPHKRQEHLAGLACLLMCRVVLPSYDFLAAYRPTHLLRRVRKLMRPDVFARLEAAAAERGLTSRNCDNALGVIAKIVLRTGKDVDELTAEDVLELFTWSVHGQHRQIPGMHMAWELLAQNGVTWTDLTLRAALHRGQRSTADLVDDYGIRCRPIRDVLVRYLDERRPAMDYNSLLGLVGDLAGKFWSDIEKHHPAIGSLHLPDDVALAWKERLRILTAADGTHRPRKNVHATLMRVRSFYLDVQQWALEDPSWVPWAVPSPVRKNDTLGYLKARRKTVAAMHQRIRERLPHLPALADAAERCRAETGALLDAARECEPGEMFDHAGAHYRRAGATTATTGPATRQRANSWVTVKCLNTGDTINLTRREDEAFWAWAIIETLRLSGVRLEELLELTHLALVSYQLPDTGEIVPLLQIVPSKGNEERLLLVSPELASVLATIITRLRSQNGGTVPLVARYDPHERLTGPRLPHLLQRACGARREVISVKTVYRLINTALAAAGLRDAAGQPLIYQPHDFRRCFTTEAVTGGLPVHIAARLLGHKSLATTETYMAVFPEDLVRAYRTFLDTRRTTRPAEEYREPTEEEWKQFQQHFQLRKVALGTCGRPYGSPCQHEHAV